MSMTFCRRPCAGNTLPSRSTPRFTRTNHTRDGLQIGDELDIAPIPEQVLRPFSDGATDLHDKPAAGAENYVRLRNEALNDFESRGASEDGCPGFKFAHFKLNLIGFALTNVRWIGHDEVELRLESQQKISLVELNSFVELKSRRIGASDLECVRRNIGRMDFSAGKFLGQCERDASRARANVDDPKIVIRLVGELKNGFDDMLGFRARNQNGRRDNQVHSPEFLMPRDVLRGNTPGALG